MRYGDLLGTRKVFSTRALDTPKPLVTVVMPTYCRHSEGMLKRCLDSVIGQTLPDFEFIVMDDGSTDGTEKVLHEMALQDPRLVHVRLERNSGLPGVLINEAVRMACGQFIAYMFDDNEWFPNALEKMVGVARQTGADLVHGKAYVVQADGQRVEYGNVPSGYESLGCFNTIPNGAVLIPRSFVDRFGLYDPHYVIGRLYDWELWLRARKMGARFAYIDDFITIEYGPTSSTSLGNAVKLNFPISAAYLQDEARRVQNAARLKPDTIDDYDILDPEQVLPYVRSMQEWASFEDSVYKPLLKRHPEYEYSPPLPHNRRYDRQFQEYILNPVFSVFDDRKRTLIMSNRVTLLVNDLRQALQADGRRIVILAPQWSGELYAVEDLDEIVIVDSVINWVLDTTLQQVDLQKPIIRIQQSDIPLPKAGAYASLQNAWQNALGVKQSLIAFPGISLDTKLKMYRDHLHSLADLTISSLPEGNDLNLQYLPNLFHNPQPLQVGLESNLYVGDFSKVSEANQQSVQNLAQQGWRIWIFPWSHLPESWTEFSKVAITSDTMPICAQEKPDALWSAVPEIACLHEGFDLACLIETLLSHGGVWVDFSTAVSPSGMLQLEEEHQNLCTRQEQLSTGLCPDARWRQWRNLFDGVAFQHRIAGQRGKKSAGNVSGQVFINSQAIGGSEAVGMQMVWALNRIGIHCRLTAPEKINVHPGGLEMIKNWLSVRNLPPPGTVDYGMVNYALFRQQVIPTELDDLIHPLRKWLEQEKPDWLFASAIIPEPAIAAADNQLVFMSMFSPWDYPLNRLTFLRDFVDGGFSDSAWAAKEWSAWLQPPFGVVRSLVEPDRFTKLNQDLPVEPIQIAVIGALQPRKRQQEAILAARILIQKGYPLKVNFYGYEFAGFTEYIEGLKRLAVQPDLAGHIFVHGFVEDMDEILANNHIVFSASGDESLPNSLLQAMAAGLIPVAAPAGGTAEAIEDHRTGFLARGFSIECLAEALERAILMRADWEEISARSRQWVAQHCSEQAFVSQLLSIMVQAAEIWCSPGAHYFMERTLPVKNEFTPAPLPEFQRTYLSLPDENRLRPGPELNESPLIFRIKPDQDGWCGIRLRFGTYFHQPTGRLQVEIRRPDNHHPMRKLEVDLDRIHDNEWLELMFAPIRRSNHKNFDIHISAQLHSGRLVIYEVLPSPLPVQLAMLRLGQASRRFLKTRLPIRRSGLAILPIYHLEDANG